MDATSEGKSNMHASAGGADSRPTNIAGFF